MGVSTKKLKNRKKNRTSEKSKILNMKPSMRMSHFTKIDVQKWLQDRRFANYREYFLHFNGEDLMNMPRRNILRLCGISDGIRLWNQIQLWKKKEIQMEKRRTRFISYNFKDELVDSPDSESSSPDSDSSDGTTTTIVSQNTILTPDLPSSSELSISRIKDVLSSHTGLEKGDINRVLIDKKLQNGNIIKVVLTDEFLSNFTLDQNCDQSISAISHSIC